jgi:hypothetical protein
MQTKTASAIESTCNVASGFVLAGAVTYFVLPSWTPPYSWFEVFQITGLYASISFVRGYLWRRVFNKRDVV